MLSKIESGYFKIITLNMFFLILPAYAVPPRLHVDGNKLKDPNGNIVTLRGVCNIDLGFLEEWHGGALNMVDRLTDKNDTQGNSPGWYPKILRIMITPPDSTDPPGSWPHPFNPDSNDLYDLLRTFVDYCGQKEVYVSIEWHYCANTYDHIASTSEFWTYMAPRFKDDTHVIYELFNEPINNIGSDSANWTSVKTDMQTWIDIVRASANDTLLFIGTPRWCQIIGPTATNPVNDINSVYITHIYPYHWLSGNQYYRDTITAAAAAHPVILGEWGFKDSASSGQQHTVGTITNYGQPLKEFVESIGIGSMAWVASYNWEPPMFANDWTLLCGEGYMGCFAKDWLYETSGEAQNINLAITKSKVKAGKNQGRDDFDISGTLSSYPYGLYNVTQADINIVSLADGNTIYCETVPFDYLTDVASNKYKYSYKEPDGKSISLKSNFSKKTFSLKIKNVDLTGLACPLRLNITMGNNIISGDANEAIVNKNKSIPTRLLRTYKDTLLVTKALVKNSLNPSSDSLSIKGDIAVADINADANEPNLCNEDVVFAIIDANEDVVQSFTIPAGNFTASRKGHTYKCGKINPVIWPVENPNTLITANIDLDKCSIKLSIKNAELDISAGMKFGVNFETPNSQFNENDLIF